MRPSRPAQRRVWCRVAAEKVRRGQILSSLYKGQLLNPGWGLERPAYKALEFHSAPGQTGTLNSHWLLGWEAVADERSGSFDADTLRYSSSGRGHWPLSEAGSRFGMLNFLLAQRASGATGAAERGAEFSLAERRFLLLLLLDFWG